MHTIKFRLIKDNKIVGYEEHRKLDDGMGKFDVFIYHSRTGHPMSWREITSCPEEYLKHDDKDQYTGLKDKNGKKIYEGDILQCGSDTRVYWTVVEHEDNKDFPTGGWTIKSSYPQHRHPHVWALTIIGNIYENPDLLENK